MLKIKFRFSERHRDTFNVTPPWQLKKIFLNLTSFCNLHCQYCHSEYEKKTGEIPIDLIENLLDQAKQKSNPDILLTGGEPFCYTEIERLLKLCHDKGLTCKIATNGTLLSNEMIHTLRKYNVSSLQVSIDTTDPEEYARIKGSDVSMFRKMNRNVERCIESRCFHMVGSAVARQGGINTLMNLMTFCFETGFETFTVYHQIPYGAAAGDTEPSMYNDFWLTLDKLLKHYENLPGFKAVDFGFPWYNKTPLYHKWKDRIDIKPIGCVAGKTSLTVLSDGEVVPCVCLSDRSVSCGNVHSDSLETIWNSPVLSYYRGEKPIDVCSDCNDFDLCRGGCRTLALLLSGRLDHTDPICGLFE